MKKVFVFCMVIFLINFVMAISMTGSAIKNNSEVNDNSQSINSTSSQENSQSTTSEKFCGKSTYSYCTDSSDCKAGGCSNQLCGNLQQYKESLTNCLEKDCYDANKYNFECQCVKNMCQWHSENGSTENNNLNQIQNRIQKAIRVQNRLQARYGNESECPNNCTCAGSTTKCYTENGREMTIRAGNSGNIIVQVKGENMTTSVTLYHHDGRVYGIFEGNETKEIKVLPDGVKEKLRQKTKARLENYEIELNEDGYYEVQAKKRSRLFLIVPVKEKIRTRINSETGEVVKIRTSWWGFLAKDSKDNLVGGCGTVTPGMNDECCQNLGYTSWNSETEECE
ncbi:MAG: hypothetical protein ABH811_03000 [archaeon]